MNKGKLWFYRDKYTSFLPYAFTQTERLSAKTNCFSEICLSASIFQSQTLFYRCNALHHGCGQNLNAKACFNLWYGLKGEVLLSLGDRGNILSAVFHSPLCIIAPPWWCCGLVCSQSWDCCWWSFIKGHTKVEDLWLDWCSAVQMVHPFCHCSISFAMFQIVFLAQIGATFFVPRQYILKILSNIFSDYI